MLVVPKFASVVKIGSKPLIDENVMTLKNGRRSFDTTGSVMTTLTQNVTATTTTFVITERLAAEI